MTGKQSPVQSPSELLQTLEDRCRQGRSTTELEQVLASALQDDVRRAEVLTAVSAVRLQLERGSPWTAMEKQVRDQWTWAASNNWLLCLLDRGLDTQTELPAGDVGGLDADELCECLSSGTGRSVIRLADGEGRAWHSLERGGVAEAGVRDCEGLEPFLRRQAAVKWRNWFGVLPNEDGLEQLRVGALLRVAIEASDHVGLRSNRAIRKALDRWKVTASESLAQSAAAELTVRRQVASLEAERFFAMETLPLWNTDGRLGRLCNEAQKVTLVTAYPEAGDYLAARVASPVKVIEIPSEHKPSVPVSIRERHPSGEHLGQFGQIRKSVLEESGPGVLTLVAGGLLGKVYTSDAALAGAVALDIGSVVDGWLGLRTRPRLAGGQMPILVDARGTPHSTSTVVARESRTESIHATDSGMSLGSGRPTSSPTSGTGTSR